MQEGSAKDEGFGLVEVIIAMMLLAIIAVALLPVLWNSIEQSTTQAASATATRELNGRIEAARESSTCGGLDDLVNDPTLYTGTAREFTVQWSTDPSFKYDCQSGTAVVVWLEAVQGTRVIATAQAKVFVP